MTNIIALPNASTPTNEPVAEIVEILTDALERAKDGKLCGIALVEVERNPVTFSTSYYGEDASRHTLGSGVLSLNWQVAETLSRND